MNTNKLMVLSAVGVLAGCATTWHHTTITDTNVAARQLVIDDGYCARVAAGSAPMPQVIPVDGPKTSNVTMTGSTYNTTTGARTYGTYTGQVTTVPSGGFAGGFASGMASGASLGAAIAAHNERDKIHKACMFAKGWSDTPVEHVTVATKAVQPAAAVQSNGIANQVDEPVIYKTPKEEWDADTEEFFLFYPAYREGALFDALNERVKAIARADKTGLTGPQILMKAHQALKEAGKAAPDSTTKESTLAFMMYRPATKGNEQAESHLAALYLQGDDVLPKDLKRSAYWAQKASFGGNASGQLQYGLLRFFGNGVTKNRMEGYQLVKKAAIVVPDYAKAVQDLESQMTPEEIRSAN